MDWGRKADYLEHYQLVIFVTCRDLNGRKEQLRIYYNYRNCRCGKQGLNESTKTKQIYDVPKLYSQLIEPSTVATFTLAVSRSNHSARSHPRVILILNRARSHPYSVRSHPHSARSYPHTARSQPYSARSHPQSARSNPHSARSHKTGLLIVVMSNQRFLKIVCFRFPTNVPKKIEYFLF